MDLTSHESQSKPKRSKCGVACARCARLKVKCEGGRPCVRCFNANKVNECVDKQHKPRNSRKRRKVGSNEAALVSTPDDDSADEGETESFSRKTHSTESTYVSVSEKGSIAHSLQPTPPAPSTLEAALKHVCQTLSGDIPASVVIPSSSSASTRLLGAVADMLAGQEHIRVDHEINDAKTSIAGSSASCFTYFINAAMLSALSVNLSEAVERLRVGIFIPIRLVSCCCRCSPSRGSIIVFDISENRARSCQIFAFS